SLSLRLPPPPSSTLFPYTTLFRSHRVAGAAVHLRQDLVHRDVEHARKPPELVALRVPGALVHVGRPELHRRSGHRRHEGIAVARSEEHTSELQSLRHLVCRLLLEK